MKKIVTQTIFMCLGLICCMSYGQGTGYLYHNNIEGWQNMIRYHSGSGKYITCSQPTIVSCPNHFALTDIQNVMIDAHVANGYFVQDFEIIGDYVFFCGYNASLSGFLGWFNINDVFNNTGVLGHAYIDETLSAYGIEQLDDIEVYYDKFQRIHIAGAGQHIVPGSPIGYKAFEAVGYSPTSMQYRVADLKGGEIEPRLTVTDDFVVYVTGARNYLNLGIGYDLEPFPKNDMFALPTHPVFIFQTVSVFTSDSDPDRLYVITNKGNNTIAICSYRSTLSSNYRLVLREFDLTPLLYGYPIQMISDSRVKLPPLGVSWIRKLAYDPLTKYYIALFRHETSPGVDEDGIMSLDYSLGYAPTMAQATYQYAYSNGYLWDMCLNGSSQYTASGYDVTYNKYYFWQDDIFSSANTCAHYYNYIVSKGDEEESKEDYCLSNVVGWIALNFLPNMSPGVQQDNNYLICN